ncbi:hypothetical protein BJ912DRAFT_1079970 [Pholiota molesta]|nr:hypothetical protein BJ912DRAFT_1079970 [Pholiota molesta]
MGVSARARMKPTQEVLDMIKQVRDDNPELQKYGITLFQVVKILQPVPQETVTPGQNSEALKRNGRSSLQPILAQFRERLLPTYGSGAYLCDRGATNYTRRKIREIPQIASGGGNEFSCAAIPISHLLPFFSHTLSGRKNLHGIVHPPSHISGHHGIHLRRFALRDGPADRYTFPVALFDKNLALLQYRLENLNVVSKSNKSAYLFPNEVDFYEVADGFILAAIAEHASDEKRVDASRPFLEAIFGKDFELEYKVARSETVSVDESASDTTFDGAYVTKIEADARSISTTVIDVNTEVHGDPLMRLAKRYAEEVYAFKNKPYFDCTYFPKLFLALNGHKLEIAIAVCLETVVVDGILSLDMRDECSRGELQQKVARVAVALKDCSTQLRAYYSALTPGPPLSFFPSPTLEPMVASLPLIRGAFDTVPDTRTVGRPNSATGLEASSAVRSLAIVRRLGLNSVEMLRNVQLDPQDMHHNLFVARWHDHADNEPELIVKLVLRYGEATHRCLAEKRLAPELYLCQPVIGGFIAVVMERAKGKPLDWLHPDLNYSKTSIFDQLKEVLTALQGRRLVHGDLRAPNIIVDAGSTIKVIDFDWAAKEGEGVYPSTINMEELCKQWHRGVGPKQKMRMKHDRYAVFEVLGPDHLDVDE